MTGAVRCASPRCRRDCDPDPVYGRQVICDHCTARTGAHLPDLAWAYTDLEGILGRDGTSARFDAVAGSRTPPVPVRLDVADHRDHIHSLLVSWTRLVVEECRLGQWPANEPHALAAFLGAHLDWLAEHPAAGDLCDEIARALGRAHRLLEGATPAAFVACPDVDEQGCTGRIRVTADATSARCPDCEWETSDLPLLGRLLRGGEPALATAADACHRMRTEGLPLTPSTLRKWLQRKKIGLHGRDQAGRNLYDLDEIRAVLEPG